MSVREELNIEVVKKLFYDPSNGFGDIQLKLAHEKFVDAAAGMFFLGGLQAEMEEGTDDIPYYSHITEMVETSLRHFTDNRGFERFLKACQKEGIITADELAQFNIESTNEEDKGMDGYGWLQYDAAAVIAKDLYTRVEQKVEQLGAGSIGRR